VGSLKRDVVVKKPICITKGWPKSETAYVENQGNKVSRGRGNPPPPGWVGGGWGGGKKTPTPPTTPPKKPKTNPPPQQVGVFVGLTKTPAKPPPPKGVPTGGGVVVGGCYLVFVGVVGFVFCWMGGGFWFLGFCCVCFAFLESSRLLTIR